MNEPLLRTDTLSHVGITLRAKTKLELYAMRCPYEISGLGVVTLKSPTSLMITGVEVLEQRCSSVHTELDADALANFMLRKARAGESLEAYRCWWHSHAAQGVFFSSTDIATIEELGQTMDWLVSVVTNRRLEFLARLDVFRPLRISLELPLRCPLEERLIAEVNDDVRRCVVHGCHAASTVARPDARFEHRTWKQSILLPGGENGPVASA